MRIVQVLPSYSYGDAVGNDVTALRHILRDAGYDEIVLAGSIHRLVADNRTFRTDDSWNHIGPDDIIIYHMAIGWELFESFRRLPNRKIAIYHNVTPATFFSRYDSNVYAACRAGISQVKSARDVFDYVLAVSEYNKRDLLSYGYTCPIDVLPVAIPYDDYTGTPNSRLLARNRKLQGHNVMFLGRVVPNKCFEDIIAAFALYKRHFDPDAHLFLVGSYDDADPYYKRLKQFEKALHINDVIFTGHISFDEILAYYTLADVFLCMSEHEGFCVPLVEAMLFNVPIIAYSAAAVPDTLGSAGLLIDDKDPLLTAGAIDRVCTDVDLQAQLARGRHTQLDRFSYGTIRDQFISYLQRFLNDFAS
jgi:glycosyltransferase involved in cell wall biosynthesis